MKISEKYIYNLYPSQRAYVEKYLVDQLFQPGVSVTIKDDGSYLTFKQVSDNNYAVRVRSNKENVKSVAYLNMSRILFITALAVGSETSLLRISKLIKKNYTDKRSVALQKAYATINSYFN